MSPEYDALRQIQSKHVPALKVEIGAVLKAARLKKGLAIEAVARQTRIPKRYLDALEADRFEEFPALVYLRGFMKGYCDFLETDFAPLWAQVEAAAAPPPAEGAAPSAAPAPEASAPAPSPAP
ncbi:MAG: helix-turn-helix domain-containing protein, partial [Elusimicrobiota bacterium]|nr:helix-turn-helix domain-containing protein [Elusimicrobiota bacterium]